MPQLENGYLKIANEIVDHIQCLDLNKGESKILWTVLRSTYGWNKLKDEISITQFEKKTGLTRRGVCKAILSLVNRGVLGREQKGTINITTYWFQKDYTKWSMVGNKKALGNKQVKGREQTGQKVGNKKAPTKDILTKDIIQKTKSTSPQARFMESFSGMYEKITGQPFKTDKHHYILISNLIKKYGYDAVVDKAKLLALYCSRADVWFAKEGWSCFTPETLSRQWNRIIPIMTEEQKKDAKFKEALKKEQEDRRHVDELVKDSLTARPA